MREFTHTISDPQGVHARPAGELVKIAKTFECAIAVKKDSQVGDCKKIFTIMALGAKCGNDLIFTFDGSDEDAACEAFENFVKENL